MDSTIDKNYSQVFLNRIERTPEDMKPLAHAPTDSWLALLANLAAVH
ncbi:MAG TPA: hypothetical protein VIN35_11160 [Hydrogenophaga sp.]